MNRRRKKRDTSEVLFIISSLFIPIFVFIVFYIIPNSSAFLMAFQGRDGSWTMDNFARVIETIKDGGSDLRIGLQNTLLAFAINLVIYPLKVLVPFFIYKKIPFYKFHRVLFFLPMIFFSVATTLVVTQLLAPSGFIAETVAKVMGLTYSPDLLADTRFANIVIFAEMIWFGFPGDLIIWGGTFARIPNELLESGRLDGTNWWTEFTRIVVPIVWPTVGLQMVLMACTLFSCGGKAFLFTKGEYGTMTLSCWLQLQLLNGSGNQYTSNVYNYMSAVGVCMTLIAVVLATIIRRNANKVFDEVEF